MIIFFPPFLLNPLVRRSFSFPSPSYPPPSVSREIDIIATRKKSWPVKGRVRAYSVKSVEFLQPRWTRKSSSYLSVLPASSGVIKIDFVSRMSNFAGTSRTRSDSILTVFAGQFQFRARQRYSRAEDDDKLTISRRASGTLSLSLFNVIALNYWRNFFNYPGIK